MKTLCLMDSVSRANGGIFEAERRLQQSLQAAGVSVKVVGLRDAHTEADQAKWLPLVPAVHAVRGPQAFGYAPDFLNSLSATDADLAYGAGLWKYPSLAALRWSRRTGKPLVVAPHGMLDAWALENSRLKKQLAGRLFQKAQLRHAACLRALCAAEAEAIRAYGLKNPIAIIPNGIDLPSLQNAETLKPEIRNQSSDLRPLAADRKVLLFLGRLHPKKGLPNLLKARAQIQKAESGKRKAEEWILAIAGWDQGGHEAELKRLCDDLGIAWCDARTGGTTGLQSVIRSPCSVVFLGPQFGAAKTACYQDCDAFILPSFSEGLPMAVLEAWAYAKPVLMTPECNLPEGFTAGAAMRIEPDTENLTQGLHELFRQNSGALQDLGNRGRQLVATRFHWPKLAGDMKLVYEWVLGGGTPPPCVVRD